MDYSDIVGMDLGLHDFCILGDGMDHAKIANPRWIKLHEKRLRRFKKALSRKQYDKKTHTGSRNWEKARKRVAKEEKKTANQRHDFHHNKHFWNTQRNTGFLCSAFYSGCREIR